VPILPTYSPTEPLFLFFMSLIIKILMEKPIWLTQIMATL